MNQAASKLPLEIDCASVKKMLDHGDDFLLLDCREADEYETVRIEGSRLLPMSELMARAAELDEFKAKHVVVHCHHGGRSPKVANWLRSQGFDRSQSMSGGIHRWAEQIDPKLPKY
jgi:rhodanese-related sulfurtransferase